MLGFSTHIYHESPESGEQETVASWEGSITEPAWIMAVERDGNAELIEAKGFYPNKWRTLGRHVLEKMIEMKQAADQEERPSFRRYRGVDPDTLDDAQEVVVEMWDLS